MYLKQVRVLTVEIRSPLDGECEDVKSREVWMVSRSTCAGVELAVKYRERNQDQEHQTVISTIPELGKLQVQNTCVSFTKWQENFLLPQVKHNNQERVVQSY